MRDTKTVGGVTTGFVWNGNNMVAETNSSGAVQNQYHYGVDGILSATLGTTNVQYLKDAHGNVVGTVNASGLQDSYYIYDAFGNSLESDPNESNPFGYCGEYLDSESGLVYLRNRYYDTTTGRFTSEDPIKDGLNWYSYCHNDPINFIDPNGLEYIVVSGSENNTIFDHRYKYNFIEPAIKKLQELKDLNDGETITWLISSTGYSEKDISNFKETASTIGVNIEFFEDKDGFIDYINTKGDTNSTAMRDNDKIHKIAFFSHGLKGSIEFGYHQFNQKNLSITSSELNLIRKEAFDNPNSCFYSCNTGTSDDSGSSFAQSWVNLTGGTTWAIYEKSDYASINNLANWNTIIKPERKSTGYRQTGSDYYPIPSNTRGAYWLTFTSNVQFLPR